VTSARRRMKHVVFGVVFTLLATTTACGGSRPKAGTTQEATQRLASQLVACLREHGAPSFPEIVIGADGLPRTENLPRVSPGAQHACRSAAKQMAARIETIQSLVGAELQPEDPRKRALPIARRSLRPQARASREKRALTHLARCNFRRACGLGCTGLRAVLQNSPRR
jgi:hypothetical protein